MEKLLYMQKSNSLLGPRNEQSLLEESLQLKPESAQQELRDVYIKPEGVLGSNASQNSISLRSHRRKGSLPTIKVKN